mmetsp:Transcript_24768/g.66825  ORF Transcript_24768/g.66825 Transcript_24768/m.66825 type:complete len:104 (+) Transcript_24768:38-349(+)
MGNGGSTGGGGAKAAPPKSSAPVFICDDTASEMYTTKFDEGGIPKLLCKTHRAINVGCMPPHGNPGACLALATHILTNGSPTHTAPPTPSSRIPIARLTDTRL